MVKEAMQCPRVNHKNNHTGKYEAHSKEFKDLQTPKTSATTK
jgi:hypothetical protein